MDELIEQQRLAGLLCPNRRWTRLTFSCCPSLNNGTAVYNLSCFAAT